MEKQIFKLNGQAGKLLGCAGLLLGRPNYATERSGLLTGGTQASAAHKRSEAVRAGDRWIRGGSNGSQSSPSSTARREI